MARKGASRYTTGDECAEIIRALRTQTGCNMAHCLEIAARLEAFALKSFPGWRPPELQPVRRGPECPEHHKYMPYSERLGRHVCPEFGCLWRAYEDEEPDSEGAHVYHQDVAEKTRDAAHGSTRRGKKWSKPPRRWKQDEGSPNAWKVRLKEK